MIFNNTIFRLTGSDVTNPTWTFLQSWILTFWWFWTILTSGCFYFAEEKETKKEESESEDEDMGFGLFD